MFRHLRKNEKEMKKIVAGLLLSALVLAKPFCPEPTIKNAETKYGMLAKERLVGMNRALDAAKDKNERRILENVNSLFNAVHYSSDMDIYQKKDYWATPWEFLGRGFGDSEDYAIAKYFALIHLGISPEKLYFTYVKSRHSKEPHMVLSYFETPTSIPMILDSTLETIYPADRRQDLIPVYNFNADTLAHAQAPGKGKSMASSRTHQAWDRLIEDIQRGKQ